MSKFSLHSESWTIDHTYENEAYVPDLISTVGKSIASGSRRSFESVFQETPIKKRQRRISHYVVYATTMIMTIGFSVILSGVWPYLKALDKSLTKESFGLVVAANPLGQMIASPLFGYLENRMGSIRYICYFTVLMYIVGNVLYALLPSFSDLWQHSAFHIMIFTRFIVGVSSANVALCRSYVATSTTTKERTNGITIVSAAQATGFVLGPVIQTILSLIIEDELLQYKTAGWVAAVLGVFNFFLLIPQVFKEFSVADLEREFIKNSQSREEKLIIPKTDNIAVIGGLFALFANAFTYVLLQTISEPFMADQYSWCDELSVVVVGIVFTIAGILGVLMFIVVTILAKKYDERKILLFCGFLPMTIGVFLFLPWGPETLDYCLNVNETTVYTNTPYLTFLGKYNTEKRFLKKSFQNTLGLNFDRDTWCDPNQCLGCPSEQTWCDGYKRLPFIQFVVGYIIVFMGYPFALSMCCSIFSKLFGPKPQGISMGLLTAVGSLARVLGPIFVSVLYTNRGTSLTFGVLLLCMLLGFSELCLLYKRLVPMKIKRIRVSDIGKI